LALRNGTVRALSTISSTRSIRAMISMKLPP
jgi:hypothetical protein